MLDIRLIRDKPDFVRERLVTRGDGHEVKIDELLRIDARESQGLAFCDYDHGCS